MTQAPAPRTDTRSGQRVREANERLQAAGGRIAHVRLTPDAAAALEAIQAAEGLSLSEAVRRGLLAAAGPAGVRARADDRFAEIERIAREGRLG